MAALAAALTAGGLLAGVGPAAAGELLTGAASQAGAFIPGIVGDNPVRWAGEGEGAQAAGLGRRHRPTNLLLATSLPAPLLAPWQRCSALALARLSAMCVISVFHHL